MSRVKEPSTRFGHARLGDGALMRRALNGDVAAYGALVDRYQAQLFRYARAMGMDPDPAEDLVQDAWIRAYSRLAECRNPERFRTWIARIVRNRCLDYRKNIRRLGSAEGLAGLESDGVPPDAAVEHAELAALLNDALDGLAPEVRDAFVMKHVEERTYQEMTEVTQVSESALKMRVHRAREALREALTRAGVTLVP